MRSPSSSSSKKTSSANGGGCSLGKQAAVTPYCSNVGLKRGPWTAEEDELLAQYIKREGEGRWRTLPKKAGLLRCGKSCRLRWMNYLRPSVKRGHITPDEEDLILRLHRLLGNRYRAYPHTMCTICLYLSRWSLIAGRIPGRTDNEIKNYWNTHLCKKLIRQGLDPKTHKPFNPNKPSVNVNKDSSSEALEHKSSVSSPIPNNITTFNPFENVMTNCDQLEGGQNMSYPTSNDEELRNCKKRISMRRDEDADDDDDLLNCCIDDSFLNSLINDDIFNEYQEVEKHHHHSSSSRLNIFRID